MKSRNRSIRLIPSRFRWSPYGANARTNQKLKAACNLIADQYHAGDESLIERLAFANPTQVYLTLSAAGWVWDDMSKTWRRTDATD